jgi:PAS domain S-box-containing protein
LRSFSCGWTADVPEEGAWPAAGDLFQHAPCGLLVTGADGMIRRVNATFCSWTGYIEQELVGVRRVSELLTMGGRVFHQTHWAPLLQIQGSAAEVKLDVVHRAGHTVPMLFNAIRRHRDGVVWHELAVMVVNDRHKYEQELLLARKNAEASLALQKETQTALEESRDQLAEADRRKDEFLATLGHELRNPLAPMRNALELLRLKDYQDEQLSQLHEIFRRQVSHMTHLVDDLLEVSRITQGKLELRMQQLDVANALQDVVDSVRPIMQAASHELTTTLPAEPIMLEADPVRFGQIFLNLLNNAAKYTPPGGKIQLSARREGSHAIIVVKDSGIGIPAEDLINVFDMFSQLAPAMERAQGGLGIGLALVRGLVELHGGTITARSAGPGQGSEFVVSLPASENGPLAPVAATVAPGSPGPGLRIVVVDDNKDAADSLAMLLEFNGHHVWTANDGLAGLHLALEVVPDVLMLDIGLPQISGYEVARRIRQDPRGSKVLLVAISGWGQEKDKLEAAAAGFDHHLTKPVDFDLLQTILTTVRSPD